MRNFLYLPAILAGLLLCSCALQSNIRADHDRRADFTAYKTYDFLTPLATDRVGTSAMVTAALKTSVELEMRNRGYARSEASPDLLVNLFVLPEEQSYILNTPVALPQTVGPDAGLGWGGYYGFRTGFYKPWESYLYSSEFRRFTPGTLSIDLVDAATRRLIWEGVGIGALGDPGVTQQTIDQAVSRIFQGDGFSAVSAVPAATR